MVKNIKKKKKVDIYDIPNTFRKLNDELCER